MTPLLALLGLSLAPLLNLKHTGYAQTNRVRDYALRGLLAVLVVAAWEHARPFAPMALWFLVRWTSKDELPSLVTWLAIAGVWLCARAVPLELVVWIPRVWVAIALVLVGVLIAQRCGYIVDLERQQEPFGWLGQRTLASAYLALVVPFAPWWCLPAFAVGLWLTGPSWLSIVALMAGACVMSPAWALPVLGTFAVTVLTFANPWTHRLIFGPHGLLAYTPRGQTLDGVWQRLNQFRLILRRLEFTGYGPNTLPRQLMRWNSMYATPEQREPLVLGDGHNEYLHHLWDYGILCGGATIALMLLELAPRLTAHDPWSASAVIAAVLCLWTFPLRVAPLGLVIVTIWAQVGR